MQLDRKLFWDVDYDALDWERYADWVIVRVFERGDVDDIRQIRRHYGDEKIRTALTQARHLPLRVISLACAILDNERSDYRCYREQALNPQPWNY